MLDSKRTSLAISVSMLAPLLVQATEEYKRFADIMNSYGYTWEAIKVTTEDGF